MRKSAVVSWYLEQLVAQGQIENEDELLERKTLVEKVIDRLMYHVSSSFNWFMTTSYEFPEELCRNYPRFASYL